MRRPALVVAVAAAAAAGLVACGGSDRNAEDLERATNTGSTILTVYAALPLEGPDASRSREAIDGMKLALRDSGGKIGDLRLNFRAIDTAGRDGEPDAEAAATAGRDDAEDRSAIAVLGGLDPEGTAVLLPVFNSAGVLLVSPASTYPGFTRRVGGGKGEPERYYPSARRTFVRLAPTDNTQADALRAAAQRDGCRVTALFQGRAPFDDVLPRILRRQGARFNTVEVVDLNQDPADLRREVMERVRDDENLRRADCALVASGSDEGAATLVRAVHAQRPQMRLYAPDALATASFARSVAATGGSVRQTSTGVGLRQLRADPLGQRFLASFRSTFQRDPGPLSAPGYEAMRVVLDAIRAAGDEGNDRRAVRDKVFATRRARSLLGPYRIDPATGDATLRSWTVTRPGAT